ncbi:hypothetical protein quinque_011182 [Culex quinquefasciatus]
MATSINFNESSLDSSYESQDMSDSSLESSYNSSFSESCSESEREEDDALFITRLSSPKRELYGICDHYRKSCICSSDDESLDCSLHYCQWKVQLDRTFHEQPLEDIPEAISGNFAPSCYPRYTVRNLEEI